MNPRTAKLVEATSSLRRRIWASLPWHFRFAEFCTRMAVSSIEAFGKAIYAEFLLHGVEGMPDIHGKPASEFDVSRKPLANHLPSGYGSDFGKKSYMMLMGKFHSPSFVEDILSGFIIRFLESGSKGLKLGSTLREAQNYVLVGLTREGLNQVRMKQKKRENPDVYFSDEGEQPINFGVFDEGPAANNLERALVRAAPKLKQIHPDAVLYVKLMLEGYSDKEIIGNPKLGIPSKLPHPVSRQGMPLTQASWDFTYKDKIFDVLKDEFRELAIAV